MGLNPSLSMQVAETSEIAHNLSLHLFSFVVHVNR